VNGGGDFTFTLDKQYLPYAVQGSTAGIDAVTLYAQSGSKVKSVTPAAYANQGQLQTVSTSLNAGQVSLTFPADPVILIPDQTQQVFLILQYHFGTA
jgi:hypothetical protein